MAASIIPGSNLLLSDVLEDDPQPDLGVLRALVDAGAALEWTNEGVFVSGPPTFVGWRELDAAAMPDGRDGHRRGRSVWNKGR